MKDKKLQVFVSSTFTDLQEERQAAVEAILSTGNIPAGMELFSAGDESQMTVIKRWIEESDVYLLILGGRYGTIEEKSEKSYTHLEFELALSLNKPLFAVVISDTALDNKVTQYGRKVIEQENTKELAAFRKAVTNNLVRFYDDVKDIKLAIHETLSEFSNRKDLIGWIRGDNYVNTGALAEEIARLTKENSELRSQLAKGEVNDNALYSTLTYKQLKGLLEKETIQISETELNLFEFLIKNGQNFRINNFVDKKMLGIYQKLFDYKVLKSESHTLGVSIVRFTEDGHNFYLKALSLQDN